MTKIISFEGCVGAGKTSLTNFFSHDLKVGKILEEYKKNPFLREFYETDLNINLESELTFLLIHYSQLKKAIVDCQAHAEFSIPADSLQPAEQRPQSFAILRLR